MFIREWNKVYILFQKHMLQMKTRASHMYSTGWSHKHGTRGKIVYQLFDE